jgi:hypothetical protein
VKEKYDEVVCKRRRVRELGGRRYGKEIRPESAAAVMERAEKNSGELSLFLSVGLLSSRPLKITFPPPPSPTVSLSPTHAHTHILFLSRSNVLCAVPRTFPLSDAKRSHYVHLLSLYFLLSLFYLHV